MTVAEDMPTPLPGAYGYTYTMKDGSVFSINTGVKPTEWKRECQIVSDHIGIPVEHNQGFYATRSYLVKKVKKPHAGLLGDRMYYWVIQDLSPVAARGMFMATLYLPGPLTPVVPYSLYIEGYEARVVAMAELAEGKWQPWPGADIDKEIWKRSRTLLDRWSGEIYNKLARIETQ